MRHPYLWPHRKTREGGEMRELLYAIRGAISWILISLALKVMEKDVTRGSVTDMQMNWTVHKIIDLHTRVYP